MKGLMIENGVLLGPGPREFAMADLNVSPCVRLRFRVARRWRRRFAAGGVGALAPFAHRHAESLPEQPFRVALAGEAASGGEFADVGLG